MKIYFDTEFIDDGMTIDLISIGLVAENDQHRPLYLVSNEFDLSKASKNDFLAEFVLPKLPSRDEWISREVIRDEVSAFFKRFFDATPNAADHADAVELWGYYSSYDFVALCQLWGRMVDIPYWVPWRANDIRQEYRRLGSPEGLPRQVGYLHNALSDALHNREMHRFLMDYDG